MKKKRLSILVTTTLLAGSIVVPTASAQYLEGQEIDETEGLEYHTLIVEDGEVETISIEEPVQNQQFIQIGGVISEILEESKGHYYVTVKGDEPFSFYFNDETTILNNKGEEITLEEGMQFTGFVDSNKPMILIYPPRYSPEVIIAQTEETGTVQLNQFDENFLNKNQDLVINLTKETPILNLFGQKLSESDVINKNVLIFYEVVLESYPAQTGPSKVIVLDPSSEELANKIIEQDSYDVNGVKMIPLRLVAEQLGYKVEPIKNGAIVSKGTVSYTITRGEKMFGYNKALRTFSEAPAILEYGKTYVPFEFLELLVRGN